MSTATTNGDCRKDEQLYFLHEDAATRQTLIASWRVPPGHVQPAFGVLFEHLRRVSGLAPEWR
jgi:hypothetical protein